MTTFGSLERSPRKQNPRRILEWILNQLHTKMPFFGAVGEDVFFLGGKGVSCLSAFHKHTEDSVASILEMAEARDANSWLLIRKRFQINMNLAAWQLSLTRISP